MTNAAPTDYPVVLSIEYPERFSRLSTFFRWFTLIPAVLLGMLAGIAVLLLTFPVFFTILIAKTYPRPLFDAVLSLSRFLHRVKTYASLTSDVFPLFDDPSVRFEVAYPDRQDLSRLMPFMKWFLVIPHQIILYFLELVRGLVLIGAWISIVITGQYPRPLFNYVVGLDHWELRVTAYSRLLVTDEYPPFAFGELTS